MWSVGRRGTSLVFSPTGWKINTFDRYLQLEGEVMKELYGRRKNLVDLAEG